MERAPAESETVQQTVQQRRARVGVTLIKPRGEARTGWRLRWTDPDTGTTRTRSLTSTEAQTKTAREETVRKQARELRRRKDEIEQGAARHREAGMAVTQAMATYFDRKQLAAATVLEYRYVADTFVTWCAENRVRTVRDITRGMLHAFGASRAKAPKRSAVAAGRRGERAEAGKRSRHTANKELRALSAILNYLRRADIIRISRDDLADGLAREAAPVVRKEFLQGSDAVRLLNLCAEHDAETFALTRDGSKATPRHKPIAPLVRALLLTGMRIGEALALQWSDVHEDRIYIRAETSKGARARTIDLSISPSALGPSPGSGSVFGLTEGEANAARKRLISLGAPAFTWHALRRTCGTYLTCAPGIYGGASAYQSAKRLGHSVTIAERHYTGQVSIAVEARTLEQALGLSGRNEIIHARLAAVHREQVEMIGEETHERMKVFEPFVDAIRSGPKRPDHER